MYKLKPKSEFSRNVLTLMTGTTIAQAIPIAISPILTRIYTPEDFGVFALYMSVASILSVVATGRYELAIMLPKKDEDAINIVALSIAISFLVSFIAFLVVFFFNASITKLLSNPEISSWLYFIPLSVLLVGVYQSMYQWNNRKKKYKILATSRVVQNTTSAIINLSMGYGAFGSSGLILGGLSGQGIATTILSVSVYRHNDLVQKINRSKVLTMAKRYVSFFRLGVPALFVSNIAQQSLLFLIGIYLGQSILGFVAFLQKIISIPSAIVGRNMGDVFYQKISNQKKEDIFKSILEFTIKLSAISIITYIVIYIMMNQFFILIFGEQWAGALKYFKYLLIVEIFSFVFSPLSILFNYYEIQHYNLMWQTLWLTTNIILFLSYGFFDYSIELLFFLYTFKQVVLYLFGIIFFLYYARNKYEK